MTKSGLGKGFSSLIPDDVREVFDSKSGQFKPTSGIHQIKIEEIKPRPKQPRRTFSDLTLKELSISIKNHGVLQPIIIHKSDNGYQIIAGERRWRAAKMAGLDEIPAMIRTLNEQERLEVSLIENLQREDLNVLEMADGFRRLIDQFSYSMGQISKRIGKAESTIHNIVRLRNLPENAKKALMEGRISEGHARAILALSNDDKKQEILLSLIIRRHWTVRQAEQFVISNRYEHDVKKAVMTTVYTNKEMEKLSKYLHLKKPAMNYPMAKGKGRIIIEYQNVKEYKRIVKKLLEKPKRSGRH